MSEQNILKQFKSSIITFVDELIEIFPTEGDLIELRIYLNDQKPIIEIMTNFLHKMLPLKKEVEERKESYFLNNDCELFKHLDYMNQRRVSHFKKMWRSDSLDKGDKQVVWKWFDTFIFLSERYQQAKAKKAENAESANKNNLENIETKKSNKENLKTTTADSEKTLSTS